MQMRNLWKANNKMKKSHILLIGSFFIFFGAIFLFSDYWVRVKDELYSDMKIAMMDDLPVKIPVIEQPQEVIEEPVVAAPVESAPKQEEYVIDYSKYLAVLEIPKIGLKRGFYNVDHKYNNIEHNVTMVGGSTLPDVPNGNLILMAHSGDAYISYFAYLYRLEVGDTATITYAGNTYRYQITQIYDVPKNGIVPLRRNYNRTTLTMITCTKDNDSAQTVYVAELIG